jgi:hypothetical protein
MANAEYLRFRFAYLRDRQFRERCDEDRDDDPRVSRYFTLRDVFVKRWVEISDDVCHVAFSDMPEARVLMDLLQRFVPRTLQTQNSKGFCDITKHEATTKRIKFITNPEKTWASMNCVEKCRKNITFAEFLEDAKKVDANSEALRVDSKIVDYLKIIWMAFNVDSFIDFNLQINVDPLLIAQCLDRVSTEALQLRNIL